MTGLYYLPDDNRTSRVVGHVIGTTELPLGTTTNPWRVDPYRRTSKDHRRNAPHIPCTSPPADGYMLVVVAGLGIGKYSLQRRSYRTGRSNRACTGVHSPPLSCSVPATCSGANSLLHVDSSLSNIRLTEFNGTCDGRY